MHRVPENFLVFEWLGQVPQKSECQSLENPYSPAIHFSILHISAHTCRDPWILLEDFCFSTSLPDHSFFFFFSSEFFRNSSPSLFLCSMPPLERASPGQEALQMPPKMFRKPKVLLNIPIITQKTSLKQLKWSPRRSWYCKTLILSFDISKIFAFYRPEGMLLCPSSLRQC